MLRPMMYAPAAFIPSMAAAFTSGCSNIHRCSLRRGPSPKGSSRRWLVPATNPSTDIAMSHVTLVILLRPSGGWDRVRGLSGAGRVI